jgi:uncharacterized protein YndB with AHSA1/START domain
MTATISPAPVRKSIAVKAAPERAFAVFTANMGRWWLRTHTINASPMKDVVIEPRVGGRWYELGEDGSQCQWGKVLAWEPPHRLLLAWQINGEWKYDAALVTEVEVNFIADGGGTRVEVEHRHLERMGDSAEAARQAVDSPGGWSGLLTAFAQSLQ